VPQNSNEITEHIGSVLKGHRDQNAQKNSARAQNAVNELGALTIKYLWTGSVWLENSPIRDMHVVDSIRIMMW
jgi:hypothetical protein